MYIINWNVTGLASRFTELKQLVDNFTPDFLCLQKVRNNSSREKFDIVGYRQLYTSPCFTRWEREYFNQLLAEADLADAYRSIYCDEQAVTFYGNYRDIKIGNRLDYFLISRSLLPSLAASNILTNLGTGQNVPIIFDFNPCI